MRAITLPPHVGVLSACVCLPVNLRRAAGEDGWTMQDLSNQSKEHSLRIENAALVRPVTESCSALQRCTSCF